MSSRGVLDSFQWAGRVCIVWWGCVDEETICDASLDDYIWW